LSVWKNIQTPKGLHLKHKKDLGDFKSDRKSDVLKCQLGRFVEGATCRATPISAEIPEDSS